MNEFKAEWTNEDALSVGWKSPIDTFTEEVQTALEGEVLKAVQRVCINVDIDEAKKVILEERVADDDPNYADAWECNRFLEAAVAGLDDLPTVEVIRCKDCQYWQTEWETAGGHHFCPMVDRGTDEQFYCADGERRDDGGIMHGQQI